MIDRNLKTKDEILCFLKDEKKREQAELFFLFAREENLKESFKITAKYYSFSFFPQNSPRALFKMDLSGRELRIKAQLFFIDGHREHLNSLSRGLKDMIRKTPPCTRCSMQCKQGVSFLMDDESYFTCINEGHYFKDMDIEECKELIGLLKAENDFIALMKGERSK